MDMTVMTFNLRYPEVKDGTDYWPNRVGRAAAVVKEHRPLVFGTQEGYLEMLTDLEPLLDDYAWVGDGRFGEHENEHCAVFYDSRELELAEHGQFWLSETPDVVASISYGSMFPRVCTWARFVHRLGGAAFYTYNTHLDHHSPEAREQGVRIIWERMCKQREQDGIPAILMGDFNGNPADPPIRFLRGETAGKGAAVKLTDAYSSLHGEPGLTAHNFRGGDEGEPIDYIFTTPDFRMVNVRVDRAEREGGYPSDHYPVVAKLRLQQN